jgi:chromosomal replication initiator protein
LELPAQRELIPGWRQIHAELRRVVGEGTYEIWLAPVEVESWDGSTLLLDAPPGTRAWLSNRFGKVVESCVRAVLGAEVRVGFVGSSSGQRRHRGAESPADPLLTNTPLNRRYSFERFIIGDGNRLAHAASLATAENPGQAYNPLFVHAAPGLGKTHLLHAIGNYVLAFGDGATVRYTTVEAFTNQFINALNTRSLDRFKRTYRNADVLLIDDVQFLASKAKTEEEFFHTFNTLYETGSQLVLTCDRIPQQMVGLEERLRERFESGLVTDIRPPDFATRVAILRKRAALDRIAIADQGVLELIAERITDNVRALEGALIRIVAHHSLTRHPIDVQLATTVLGVMRPEKRAAGPSINDIQSMVASRYGISTSELVSSSRAARVNWPRQLAIHLARELTDASLPAIGKTFGGRSHATVLHACKRVSERLGDDQQAAGELGELRELLVGNKTDRRG